MRRFVVVCVGPGIRPRDTFFPKADASQRLAVREQTRPGARLLLCEPDFQEMCHESFGVFERDGLCRQRPVGVPMVVHGLGQATPRRLPYDRVDVGLVAKTSGPGVRP